MLQHLPPATPKTFQAVPTRIQCTPKPFPNTASKLFGLLIWCLNSHTFAPLFLQIKEPRIPNTALPLACTFGRTAPNFAARDERYRSQQTTYNNKSSKSNFDYESATGIAKYCTRNYNEVTYNKTAKLVITARTLRILRMYIICFVKWALLY